MKRFTALRGPLYGAVEGVDVGVATTRLIPPRRLIGVLAGSGVGRAPAMRGADSGAGAGAAGAADTPPAGVGKTMTARREAGSTLSGTSAALRIINGHSIVMRSSVL